ncbi:MAG: DnaA/Hda family protein, partial [Myxococcota bacterium]
ESFVVGPCNALAREATLALARRRQRSLNQVYLAGASGMGKTHLARAAATEARLHSQLDSASTGFAESRSSRSASARPEQAPRVIYTSAEQFTSEFVSAMRLGQPEQWKRRYRGSIGLLIVEDVQFFSGRTKTQLELFHTVQHVLDAGGSVLLTGDRAPRDLIGLDERMRAQVGRGFVAELEMPDALVRRQLLRAKAAGGGVHLPPDCLDLLVDSTAGSVRDVESMLIQVVTTASLLGRKIDLGLVQEAVALKAGESGVIEVKTLASEEIVRIVAAFFGKPAEALAGRSRRRDVLIPRQLAMYLAHRYTDASFAEIGRALGRDHPSVRNAIMRIERLVLESAPLRYQVESLSERIDQFVKDRKSG